MPRTTAGTRSTVGIGDTAYRALVAADGALYHWPMDEASGNFAGLIGGIDLNATAMQYRTGGKITNNGASLNGATSTSQSASALQLSAYQRIVVESLVFIPNYPLIEINFLFELSADYNANAGSFAFLLNGGFNGAGAKIATLEKGNVGTNYVEYARATAGAWHHLALVYDFSQPTAATEMEVYINGALQTPSGASSLTNNNTGNFGNYVLNIGSRNGASFFGGKKGIQHVAVYGGSGMTAAKILEHANASGAARTAAPTAQNLLLHSEDFSNAAWQKTVIGTMNVTANAATAPDGAVTADLLYPAAAASIKIALQDTAISLGKVYTDSYYIKAAGYSWFQLFSSTGFNTTTCWVNFNASTGAIGNVGAGAAAGTYGVEALANGWYRVWLTAQATSTTAAGRFGFGIHATDVATLIPSATNDGVSGIYVWGAQRTIANWPGVYVPTTTVAVNTGNIRSIVSTAQNLLRRSQEFLTSPWTKNGGANVTTTADTTIAPDGTTTADTVAVTVGGTNQGIYYDYAIHTPLAVGKSVVFSVWLKGAVGGETVEIGDASSRSSKTLTTAWVRYTNPYHAQVSSFQVIYATTSSTPTFYVWGAQLVEANWEGPYQVTTSAAVNTGNIRSIVT